MCAAVLPRFEAMVEILRTNDMVFLSWVQAALASEGIEAVVFDAHTSVAQGSITALERRLMVVDEDEREARAVVEMLRREPGFNG